MKCQGCQAENESNSNHCADCGMSLVNDAETSAEFDQFAPVRLSDINPSNPLVVRGYNGQISFDGKSVSISRKGAIGFLTQGLKGTKEIPLRAISSIQMKKAGMVANGYIQFATGAGESKGGINAAVTDENTVIFTLFSNEEFEELKSLVTEALYEPAGGSSPTSSSAEQLEKLAKLLDQGLLTKAEFLAEKKKILN